ncbi:MAG: hypothetical protein BWZ10_03028 [candidate division BRC1 bacterium ADurb.BinA364]|nr:MAG: hypothetical protein BWZ10_03028 [candidate division BRC1 bacterium ADurb.BinA364]
MGLAEQIEQKAFLGTEFLTWLWHKSELEDGKIALKNEDPVEVQFQDAMTLEAHYGEATIQTLRGETPGASAEARSALIEGKKAKRAKIHLAQGEMEWTFVLRGDTFDFGSIKVPAPKGLPIEESVSLRLQAVDRLFELVHRLFETFLEIRLQPGEWAGEIARFRQWIETK